MSTKLNEAIRLATTYVTNDEDLSIIRNTLFEAHSSILTQDEAANKILQIVNKYPNSIEKVLSKLCHILIVSDLVNWIKSYIWTMKKRINFCL